MLDGVLMAIDIARLFLLPTAETVVTLDQPLFHNAFHVFYSLLFILLLLNDTEMMRTYAL